MQIVADLHTHTLVSTHALSTFEEMISQAKKLGLKTIAVTDHAPEMPDSPHIWYFSTLLHVPQPLPDGFLILKGVEANILDSNGKLDMPVSLLEKLDWVIASNHRDCIEPLTFEEATKMWLAIAENPLVDMIGHSEQRDYFYDYDLVTKAFAKNNKVVEINANSFLVRPGNEENMKQLALSCKKNNTKIAINSDAHSVYSLANFNSVMPLLKEIDFPEQLVVNASVKQLSDELKLHGKHKIAALVAGIK